MTRTPEWQPDNEDVAVSDNATETSHNLMKQEIRETSGSEETLELYLAGPTELWKGKKFMQGDEELIPDVISFRISGDSFEEIGSASFRGAGHPPEPVDTNLMAPICVSICQNSRDGKCLVESLHMKDLSLHSPAKNLVEEPHYPTAISSSTAAHHSSQNQEARSLEETYRRCDASLLQGGNVSRHSSIEGISTLTATSTVNIYAGAYRRDGFLSADRNCESTKGSILGESLESTKSSLSRVSMSSGFSDESNWSNTTGSANKPHRGNDPRWNAIFAIQARDGVLGMNHFRLLKRVGRGDIGSVYLSELTGTRWFFAMKVTDKASLPNKKKLARVQIEQEILQLLDHPFLPTLYSHFETDRFSCLVMEYCPGGDLLTLRHQQLEKRFSEYAARFYAAEVLLALEYLHMLGVVYRDLKPENVLVREDGHIMLSDFDLSFRCAVSPSVTRKPSLDSDPSKRGAASCLQPSSVEPTAACIQPGCFLPRIFSLKGKRKSRNSRADHPPEMSSPAPPEMVAEPTAARSMSFVGTHEYLAPEIIRGEGHGSAVDWWTFGIFLHELLYGKTPFRGSEHRTTVLNIIGQQLKFPDSPTTCYASRDLIHGLLAKEPQNRLGVKRGAAEIKQHPFFEGINWPLIRCSTPPMVPELVESTENPGVYQQAGPVSEEAAEAEMKSGGKYLDFEFF